MEAKAVLTFEHRQRFLGETDLEHTQWNLGVIAMSPLLALPIASPSFPDLGLDGPQVDNAQPPARIEVPDFDPLDGGVDAIILFLFEKPGPMTSTTTGARTRTGSGFISRDNDDSTAENTFTFMREAGIPRKQTVTWNVVPWWDGTTKVTAADLREGAEETRRLMGLLPRLRVVVFVGKKALRARPHLEDTGLAFFSSYHPSPKVRATRPDKWREIPSVWAEAWARAKEPE